MPEPFWYIAALYWAVINLAAAAAALIDKRRAKRGAWRIPERTLLLLGFFGGALGEYIAMRLIHHKTKHPKFMVLLPLFFVLHLAAIGFSLYFFLR